MIGRACLCALRNSRGLSSIVHDLKSAPVDSDVLDLAQRIFKLNMIQTSQLSKVLQETLGISPAAINVNTAQTQGNAGEAAKESAAKPAEPAKSAFKVVLEKIDAAAKAKIIREIKLVLPQLNLVEAKALVEGAPRLIKENCKKEEAEKIKATLEGLGATISLL